jgi:hypothetical protein
MVTSDLGCFSKDYGIFSETVSIFQFTFITTVHVKLCHLHSNVTPCRVENKKFSEEVIA